MNVKRGIFSWAVAALLCSSICFAQKAQIVGRITDVTGAVVPAAAVTVSNVDTGIDLRLKSNDAGYYAAPLLPTGNYKVSVEMQGFRPATRVDIRLDVEQVARIDFTLTVGQISEQVLVSAEAALVATQEASLATVVDRRKILELPLNGRDVLSMLPLIPGALPNPRSDTSANINGGRENTSDILIDGAPSTKTDQGDTLAVPLLEGVEEFTVQTGSINAEYGRAMGVMNVVTKSGTNDLHGSGFEFLRNDALNANNFFFNSTGQGRQKLRYNQFGGSVGGPVYIPKLYNGRNRTFFFFTPQFTRNYGKGIVITSVPLEVERNGDFRQSGTNGAAVPIFDPASTRPQGNTYVRDAFPNSMIPASRFDAIGLNILKYGYPLPNAPGRANNFVSGGATSGNGNNFMGRVDHNFTPQNHLWFRFLRMNSSTVRVETWPGMPAQGGSTASFNHGPDGALREDGVLGSTISITPNLLNEFKYSVLYSASTMNPASKNQGWAQKLGIQNAAPYLFPNVAVSGYTGLFGGNLSTEGDASHQFGDQVTWIRGAHNIKTGVEIRPMYFRNQQPGAATAGNFTFDTQPTKNPALTGTAAGGQSLASLLLGVPSIANITINNTKWGGYWRYMGAFIQDQWKVSPKLTLTYGLRWEYTRPREEHWNRQSVFDLRTMTLQFAGVNGWPEALFQSDYKNFAPRIGLAYSPGSGHKTSIRGAFGMYFLPINTIGSASEFTLGFSGSTTWQTLDSGITFPLLLKDSFPVTTVSPTVTALTTVSTIGPKYPTPYMNEWTLSIQREILPKTLLDVTYTGTKGTHLQVAAINLNQVPASLLGPGNAQARRPYPNNGTINYPYDPIANSIFHGMQVKLEHRFSSGFNLLGWYTLQKSIDDSSGMSSIRTVGTVLVQNDFNMHAERSISTFDRTHNVVVMGVYELPFGRGKKLATSRAASALFGGWQLNGILTLRSGVPLSMVTVQDNTGSFGGTSRPNRLRSGQLSSGRTIAQWFDTSAFVPPPQYQFGNDSRTEPDLRGPGTANLDMSIFRNFRFAEKATLQFRGEAFNTLNHANFAVPSTTIGSAAAGTITSAADGRSMQLGVRLSF